MRPGDLASVIEVKDGKVMSGKTVTALGTAVVLSMVLAWSRLHGVSDLATPRSPPAREQTRHEVANGPSPAPANREAADPGGGPPVIDSIHVEKNEVCRGEDNFATVTVHARDGADQYLRISITDPDSGRLLQGTRIPFHLERQPVHPIRVFVEGRRRTSLAELPEIRVKDCDAPRRVNLAATRNPDTRDRVLFTATVVDNPDSHAFDGAAFRAATYDWDFGDGQTEQTTDPFVTHSYESRSQTSVVSVYLVKVHAKERGDRGIDGATTVPLTNLGFVPLVHENTVLIRAGVIRKKQSDEPEKIWVYHGHSYPVSIDAVEVVEPGPDARPDDEPRVRELSPQGVLGFSSLEPGESRELPQLDPALTRPGEMRMLRLRGHTHDGKRAVGTIALAGPERDPMATKDN